MSPRRDAARIGIALVVLLGACSNNVGLAITRRPGGGGGGGAGGDGGSDKPLSSNGDPSLSANCSNVGVASIRDNFQGRIEVGPHWAVPAGWAAGQLVDGQLVLRLTDVMVNVAGLKGTDRRSIRDCAAQIELLRVPDADPAIVTGFIVGHDSANYLGFRVVNQRLIFIVFAGGQAVLQAQKNYDPVAHRWLRIRDDQDTTFYETSPDGQTWNAWGWQRTQAFADDVDIEMYLSSSSGAPGPYVAVFDNLNVLP